MEVIDSFIGEYDFLSNFYFPCDILFEGKLYPSTEHAFQAAKTLDSAEREKIRRANTPGIAKRLGRSPKEITMRPDCESIKTNVMLQVLRVKFAHEDLKQKLLATGDAKLVEGNLWGDTCWGVCNGVGENRLGILLMQVRDELRAK